MQQYPQQLQKHVGTWASRLPLWARISGPIAVVMLAICMCAGICADLGKSSSANANQPPATQQQQQPTATAAPIHPPALGGTQAEFTARFGDPTCPSAYLCTYTVAGKDGTSLAGIQATVNVRFLSNAPGARVEYIEVIPDTSGAKWTQATYAAFLILFLPSDAKYQRLHTTADGSRELVYKSATLAQTFSAEAFKNTDTSLAVAPGTFITGQITSDSNNIIYMLGM